MLGLHGRWWAPRGFRAEQILLQVFVRIRGLLLLLLLLLAESRFGQSDVQCYGCLQLCRCCLCVYETAYAWGGRACD